MTTSMGTPSRNLKMFDRVVAVDAVSLLIGPSRGGRRLTNLATRLRPIFRLVLAVSILAATLVDPAHAQGSPVYLVTYVSVMPNAVVSGATLLERYRDASRKEAGNQRLDVLQETTRPNRFAILEAWKDEAGFMAHDKAASTLHFRDELEKILDCAPRRARQQRHLWPPGEGRGSTGRNLCPYPCRRLSAV